MLNREQLFIGLRFDLLTRPGHYFRLESFARPAREGETPQWSDRIDDKIVKFVPCGLDEATHVHGWESYACFPSIDRLLVEGNLPPYIKERWAFTPTDFDDLEKVKRDDTFLAFFGDEDVGVYVDRRGKSTGQYSDGEFGVTDEDAELADGEDTLHRVVSESEGFGRNLEETHKWLDVLCTEDGKFVALDIDEEDAMNTISVLESVHEHLAGDERHQGIYLDFPGYLHVINKKGRHYNVGFDGKTWAVDTYKTEASYYDGSQPDDSGDLAVPEGTTDPETVAKALIAFIGA